MELISESERKLRILKGKAEALSLTCHLANVHWNRIKMLFNMPLVIITSIMAIINSITENGNDLKLYNIIVNSISVLLISLNNTIKASEKADNFKKLSQSFLLLVSEIDNDDNKDIHRYNIKFDNLINEIEFSDINPDIKKQVNMYFEQDELPLQIKIIDFKNRIEISNAKMKNSIQMQMQRQRQMEIDMEMGMQSLSRRPSVELERQSVVLERQSVVLERQSVVLERPSVVLERPSVVLERQSVVLERPSVELERPSVVLDNINFSRV